VCCGPLLASVDVGGVSAADGAQHLELDPTPRSVARARRFVVDHAGETGNLDTLLLLTSEIVTNGVLHARTALVVGVVNGADTVLVTVTDDNSDAVAEPPIDHDRPSGRGLLLVRGLAEEWGVETTSHGKTVWFTVARRTPALAQVADG
jgi:anti-sigma regulatory factor (Ser/Thr protein kinase)